MTDVLEIDGGQGEGGGQVLRTSLALSAITGRPVRIERIRAGRAKPGLLRQHLAGVRACAQITGAQVEGDALGSTALTFEPGPVRPGSYRFAVGSAGSANLVLQTVLPPLMCASGPSHLELEGGTHNDASPPFHFLQACFLPLLAHFGPRVELELERWGFYPAGGGRMLASIEPGQGRSIDLIRRGEPELSATAVVSQLTRGIAERELKVLGRELGIPRERLQVIQADSPGPGNVCWVTAQAGSVTELFTGFGRKNASAEQVASDVVAEVKAWLAHGAPVGEHLADQLLVPLALAGTGRFTTGAPSLHTLTNMAVIERFLPIRFASHQTGPAWTITVDGA